MKPNARRMLSPVAYSEASLPSLTQARASRLTRRIGKALFFLMAVGIILVVCMPWQQSVKGTGDVIAYDPLEREQTIETPIKGRIVRLGEEIRENAYVKTGDLIAEVADVDPEYFLRLEAQLAASQRQLAAAQSLLTANNRNLEAAQTIVTSMQDQVDAYKLVKEQAIAAADAAVESARNKIEAEQQQLLENEAALVQVQADYDRQETLFSEKIIAVRKFQESERKLKETQAKVEKSKAYVRAAQNELIGKQSDRKSKEQEAQVKIDYAIASMKKANADVAKAESDVAKAQSELTKADKALLEMKTKVERQRRQSIHAPFDGFITRIMPNKSSQILKEGDPICVIVPDTKDRAVQVWLDGNDAPLVKPGRHVRLQFEGWPAVQFAGWPSVSVGTFGGTIISVDATDDGKGKFRVLILPDESDQEWPDERYLRQGVRANAWVLLNQVPMWYEIWRKMNGFPPVISDEKPKNNKPPKLPKL